MLTVFINISHRMTCEADMPVIKDDIGGGAMQFRRRFTRALRRFQFTIPDAPDAIDPVIGLLEQVQGDTPIWFDGGAFAEIHEPIIIGIGDGATADFILPHRHVFVASTVVYLNGGVFAEWQPLGGDNVTMEKIRFDSAPAADDQITAKYVRKYKCVLDVDSKMNTETQFIDDDNAAKGFVNLNYFLQEVAI